VVRLAPYDHGHPAQSRELLALQVLLDREPGEGRDIAGGWVAEWPSSLWTAGVLTSDQHAVRRCWAITTSALFDHGVLWRLFQVGDHEHPLIDSWLGAGAAGVVWECADFVGIDLTPEVAQVPWAAMSEAVLEMDAIPQSDPTSTKTMRVPITAR
jgi:hypothetical protein